MGSNPQVTRGGYVWPFMTKDEVCIYNTLIDPDAIMLIETNESLFGN
jgi:hypothetical protein